MGRSRLAAARGPVLLLLLALFAPQTARAAFFGAETFTLANGLQVVVVETTRSDKSLIRITI